MHVHSLNQVQQVRWPRATFAPYREISVGNPVAPINSNPLVPKFFTELVLPKRKHFCESWSEGVTHKNILFFTCDEFGCNCFGEKRIKLV